MAIRPYNIITVSTTMARKGLWADFIEAFFVFVDWILTLSYLIYFSDASILVRNLSIADSDGPFNFEIWRNQS
jgi:hypothetical protein